jgi:hypothetical protein
MFDRENIHEHATSKDDAVPELKKLAFMYHAFGNYEKSDEIMNVVHDIETKRQERRDKRRKAA